MRRYFLLVLFFLLLAAPFVLRNVFGRSATKGAASSAEAPRLVVVTPHNQDIRREFSDAFSRWHAVKYGSAVTMDFRTLGGTNDIKRQLETTYQMLRKPDGSLPPPEQVSADLHIVWGGGDYFFNSDLKPLGVLQPIAVTGEIKKLMDASFPQSRLAGVKLYDESKDSSGTPQPQWIGCCLSSFGIVYNPDLFERLGLPAPNAWPDLTHEKLAGLIALADPTRSGSASVAYMMVIQRKMADAEEEYRLSLKGADGNPPTAKDLDHKTPAYQEAIARGWHRGMGDLLLMAANARYFTDSAPLVPSDVGDGQAAAGIAIDFYGRVYEETVGPRRCTFVTPPSATAITPDPVAILYGVKGEKLELARHFVEFLLTSEGQLLWIHRPKTAPNGEPVAGYPAAHALRRPPIRADLYAAGVDRSDWSDQVNPFTDAGTFNQRGEWMALFSDTRPIWAAAWIDARDELLAAHTRILAIPDVARRAALRNELADLPIQMNDVRKLMEDRQAMEKANGDLDQWKARERLRWATAFRGHYSKIAR